VFFASTLPVQKLLQPRDYINGHELFVAMGLLALGLVVSRPEFVAPAFVAAPAGAPPLWPFLFIMISCGAISGFHSIVASGTTAKQLSSEKDALPIGYGAMLLEGMLAILAIVAVSAGIGLAVAEGGLSGSAAWQAIYADFARANGLGAKVGAFVDGSSKMLMSLGIPFSIAAAIMGVFVASFASTTLDSATRLQRYIISEIGSATGITSLKNKYLATAVAVVSGGALALWDGVGKGGLILWPLFGATNQLLAALALLVLTVYLAKSGKKIYYTALPFCFMSCMTGWAMVYQIREFFANGHLHLLIIATLELALEIWMIVEAVRVLHASRSTGINAHAT